MPETMVATRGRCGAQGKARAGPFSCAEVKPFLREHLESELYGSAKGF
jgi:hypothetical protein